MKKIITTILGSFVVVAAMAQPPAGEAKVGDWYGSKIAVANAISIADIPAQLEKSDKVQTKVTAKVLDVCPKKGCWIKLAVNDSTTAFVKMKDYAFFLPTAVKGKTIVLEGEATTFTTSVDELRHYAKDAKKSKAEIEAITEPKKEIRFLASGIQVVQ
jgi:hypothetical protein